MVNPKWFKFFRRLHQESNKKFPFMLLKQNLMYTQNIEQIFIIINQLMFSNELMDI